MRARAIHRSPNDRIVTSTAESDPAAPSRNCTFTISGRVMGDRLGAQCDSSHVRMRGSRLDALEPDVTAEVAPEVPAEVPADLFSADVAVAEVAGIGSRIGV